MRGRLLGTAIRQLRSNKLATLLMASGIIVGIAMLTVVIALGQGTKARILERVDRMGTADTFTIRTTPWGEGGGGGSGDHGGILLGFQDIVNLHEHVPGVSAVLPTLNARGTVTAGVMVLEGVSVQGVSQNFQQVRNWAVQAGVFFSDFDIIEGARAAVIGQAVANHFFAGEDPLGKSILVEGFQLEVVGVLAPRGATGSGRNADEIVLVPQDAFTKVFQPTGISTVTVQVENVNDIERLAQEAKAYLETLFSGGELYVRIPMSTVGTRQETSNTFTRYLTIVAAVALLIGGIIMMNLTSLSISARTREIGLRKALGARNKDISLQILFETTIISIFAGLLGVVFGYLLKNILAARLELQTVMTWHAPVTGLFFAIVIGLFFGVRPANRAARLDPVTALRSAG
ncbi:MAG: ABC transporter permease [Clostridiales bacterium]|jgi:ABC-type antimicrobial peptide transport system permease subunit|nr:ABC transporter permease [Clostridiales bacterium]